MSDSFVTPSGSSVHAISQARILEWAVISFSRGSPNPCIEPAFSCTGSQVLYHWVTREAHYIHKQTMFYVIIFYIKQEEQSYKVCINTDFYSYLCSYLYLGFYLTCIWTTSQVSFQLEGPPLALPVGLVLLSWFSQLLLIWEYLYFAFISDGYRILEWSFFSTYVSLLPLDSMFLMRKQL